MTSPRLKYLLLALVTIALGLGVRHFLSGAPAKYLGVALYAVMVVFLVRFVRPSLQRGAACVLALVVCFAIEVMQLTEIPARLNASFPPLRYVLGQVFSWWDLVAYGAGAGAAYLVMMIRR